jgi:predicted RNA-binding Zn-ribbon protein involved in translation (DUF1610 family)
MGSESPSPIEEDFARCPVCGWEGTWDEVSCRDLDDVYSPDGYCPNCGCRGLSCLPTFPSNPTSPGLNGE